MQNDLKQNNLSKMNNPLTKNQPRKISQGPQSPRNWGRLIAVFAVYLLITIFLIFVLGAVFGDLPFFSSGDREEVTISSVIESIKKEEIEKIIVAESDLTVTYKDGTEKTSRKESGMGLIETLEQAGVTDPANKVDIEVKTPLIGGLFGIILSNLLPIVIMIVFFLFLFRQAGKSAGGMFDFGKSNAKLYDRKLQKVTFQDAAGVDEAKHELEEVVDFLKNPDKYHKLGARIPKGVLLIGPAGTGKTLLARAVANEAEVPFYSMAGSEFMEMLVGVGASRVRDLFKNAKENSPALIFIDEIESIGRQRGQSVLTSHGEQEQTLNQILVEMDGFTRNDHVIVIAATNRPDLLDSALTRPGRFDRTVILQLPDIEGREDIIKIHLKNKPLADDVNVGRIARRTVGFSGADLENMLNEAAILAASKGKTVIESKDFEESITKVKLGRERRRVQSDEDKKMTAYHEAGHAIVAKRLPNMDPVHRVSIVSRGLALGFTEINPDKDRSHQTKKNLEDRITTLLGGRAAELLVYQDMSVGAGDDLGRASMIAHKMVSEFGMSELGPIAFSERAWAEEGPRDIFGDHRKYSEEMAAKIDRETKKIIDDGLSKAQQILGDNRKLLDKLMEELMKHETIELEQFDKIVSDFDQSE